MIKKINKAALILLLLSVSFLISHCTSENDTKEAAIDIENIKFKLHFERFDNDIFQAKTAEEILKLEAKYPDFYPVYMYQIMGDITNGNRDPLKAASNWMQGFGTIADFGLGLKQRVDSIFPTLEPYKLELTKAMKRQLYYFPKDTIPTFVTFVSPLRYEFSNIEGCHMMGIGLDMFLGSDFGPYHFVNPDEFPNYRIRKLRPDYLLPNTIKAFCQTRMPELANQSRLIDDMIYEGKLLYWVNALIPETEDSLKLGYTPNQLKWAQQNESEVWAALVDTKVLYTTQPEEIKHYINEAPFTTANGFGMGTAPRIGAYVGWQIIKKYMSKNPKITLAQLLAEKDTDKILTQSKYKP
jgi:hypothetical protein